MSARAHLPNRERNTRQTSSRASASEYGDHRARTNRRLNHMDPTANEGVSAFSGLKYFRALMEGSIARSAMLELFDINIEAAEPGGEGRLLDAKGIRLPKKSVLRHELGARGRRPLPRSRSG